MEDNSPLYKRAFFSSWNSHFLGHPVRNRDDGKATMIESFYCPIGGRHPKFEYRTCHAMIRLECSHDDQTVVVYKNQFPHTHVIKNRGLPCLVKRLMRKAYQESKGSICSVNKMKTYLRANDVDIRMLSPNQLSYYCQVLRNEGKARAQSFTLGNFRDLFEAHRDPPEDDNATFIPFC